MSCQNKCVLITGASSGIGQACAEQFAKEGARLLLCARRVDKLQQIAKDLAHQYFVDIHYFPLDVRDVAAVSFAIDSLPSEWKNIDILVNNAGLAMGLESIHEGHTEDWELMIDTNVKGLLYVTKKVLAQMVKQNSGHIINISSIAGHQVYPGGAVYCATKFAVNAISEGIKMDVHGTPIRVSRIDPGMVKTDFSVMRFKGDVQRADSVYAGVNALSAADVAETVLFCATRPPHVDVREIVLMPTDQTSALMCHRRHENN
jgi:3-hydroxy acid dehydrogenase/malonic semialdehyde reductase